MIKRNKGPVPACGKQGFTMVEMLVVIAIIGILAAMLLPAINKARAKAFMDKAKAQMAHLASTASEIYLDTGAYIRLKDYDYVDPTPGTGTDCQTNLKGYGASYPTVPNLAVTTFTDDLWQGPYATYQEGSASSTDMTNGTFTDTEQLPAETPFDPWGKVPYALCWYGTEKVMVIYSAGPDKTFQITPGTVTVPSGSDDLIYKFR